MWDSLTDGACLELLRLFDLGCASSHHQRFVTTIVHFAPMHGTYWLMRVEVYRYTIPANVSRPFVRRICSFLRKPTCWLIPFHDFKGSNLQDAVYPTAFLLPGPLSDCQAVSCCPA
jgi:hypothetical protein